MPVGLSVPPRRRTHADMNEYRRESLIRATIDSLAEQGIEGATVITICERAGASRGLINHHFKSKEDLFVETYEALYTHVRKVSGDAARDFKDRPRQQLEAIARAVHDPELIDEKMKRAYLVFWTASMTNERFAALNRLQFAEHKRRFTRLFEQAAAAGGLAIDAANAANGLLSLIDGIWLEASISTDQLNSDQAIKLCLDYVDRALR